MDGRTLKNTQDKIKVSKKQSNAVMNMDSLVEGGRKAGYGREERTGGCR